MRATVRLLVALTSLVMLLLPACGGGNAPPSSSPPPTPPPPAAQNPCTALPVEPSDDLTETVPTETGLAKRAAAARRRASDRQLHVLDALWLHKARRDDVERALADASPAQNIGEIAVLQDAGDVILPANTFDLTGAALRFTPSGSGFSVTRATGGFRSPLGSLVTLDDDDSAEFTVPFPFTYYGRQQTRVFVNSDGNLTFEQEDRASSDRDVSRVLTGPPRIAPFFADLDPTTGSGRVYVQSGGDAFTVTWCSVRGFDVPQNITIQATLLTDGTVEMRYGDAIGLKEAVVAVSPGRSGGFTPVDLSAGASTTDAVAVGERFASGIQLDLVAVGRRFYRDHADRYDQIVLWTDTNVTNDAFAFETTVANAIRGIGIDVYDDSAAFGSARLESMVMMDTLSKYPSDPLQRFLGENSTVSLMGQEVGHRWLAFLEFRNASGARSDALLGRDQAHWSFFMDSDASVMEGNDVEDLGGGSFRTKATVSRYSRLDQYAMGLVGQSDVPAFFYVESPTNVQPPRDSEAAPETGVTFNGTKRTVLIQDVIAVMGARSPSFRNSPRVIRQAFVYVVTGGRSIDPAQVAKIDRFRRAWETFFAGAVEKRMRAETRLNPPS